MTCIPADFRGWWRIIDTGTWVNDYLDDLGPALLSLTGLDDRLRMHCLLASVNARPTKTGVSFTWDGAWEYDQMSGTGSVKPGKNGRLKGKIRIKNGDESTFIAERANESDEPIPDPPSYRDKCPAFLQVARSGCLSSLPLGPARKLAANFLKM